MGNHNLQKKLNNEILCPRCGVGKAFGNDDVAGKISIHCSYCNRFFLADLDKRIGVLLSTLNA